MCARQGHCGLEPRLTKQGYNVKVLACISGWGYREDDPPALLSGVVDNCAVVSRGMTLTVAERR